MIVILLVALATVLSGAGGTWWVAVADESARLDLAFLEPPYVVRAEEGNEPLPSLSSQTPQE